MTKRDKKRYDALLRRVTDIYSRVVGGERDGNKYFVGAEELSVISPAIAECLFKQSDPHKALVETEAKRDRLRETVEAYIGALESTGSARLDGLRAALQEAER